MARHRLLAWLRGNNQCASRGTSLPRLAVHPLEDRTAPAIIVWDGEADLNFTNPINWVGNKAPTVNDDAVIPAAFAGQAITLSKSQDLRSLDCAASMNIVNSTMKLFSGGVNNTVFRGPVRMMQSAINTGIERVTFGAGIETEGASLQGPSNMFSAGSFDVFGGGTIAGNFWSNGLTFRSGTVILKNNTNINNATVTVAGATVQFAAGAKASFDTLTVSSGDMSLPAGGSTYVRNFALNNGRVIISSAGQLRTNTFEQSAGELSVDGFLTAKKRFRWRGGSQSGNGETLIPANCDAAIAPMNPNQVMSLDSRHISIQGKLRVFASTVLMSDGAAVNNQVEGTLVLDDGAKLLADPFSNGNRIMNAGRVRSTGGTTTIGVEFTNTPKGIINVLAGTLQSSRPVTLSGRITGHGTLEGQLVNSSGIMQSGRLDEQLTLSGNLRIIGNYHQSGTGGFRPSLRGKGFANDHLIVDGTVSLGGSFAPTLSYPAKSGDQIIVLENDGSDAINGTFDGLPDGATLTVGPANMRVSYKGGDGNDLTLSVLSSASAPPPRVLSVQINDGSPQRSMVTSLVVYFDAPVNLPSAPESAFKLMRLFSGESPSLTVVPSGLGSNATITFNPGVATGPGGSLADGIYNLTIMGALVSNANGQLDGNGDGIGGDDFVLANDPTTAPPSNIFRLFGDADGNGIVDRNDFIAFRLAYGGSSFIFDFNGDGVVSLAEYYQFRPRYQF